MRKVINGNKFEKNNYLEGNVQTINSFCYKYGKTNVFLLANTLNIVSFILFLGLSDGHSLLSVLPFGCFYTVQLVGIFFINEAKSVVSSVYIERLALLSGLVGTFFAMLGTFFFGCYVVAGILIGLSSSWLAIANLTVNHYQPNKEVTIHYSLLSIGIVLLLGGLSIAGAWRFTLSFALYFLFYLIGFQYIREAIQREKVQRLSVKEWNTLVSKKESLLFLGMGALIFLLWIGRLVNSEREIELALIGFCILFFLFFIQTKNQRTKWKVAKSINVLCFFNGVLGNYLILFGAIYVSQCYGQSSTAWLLYVPYAVGMLGATVSFSFLVRRLGNYFEGALFGILFLGFCTVFFEKRIFGGFLFLNYGLFLLNLWLNRQYLATTTLHKEQQLVVKKVTQNKGAITHQFVLMLGFLLAGHFQGFSLQQLFQVQEQIIGNRAITSSLATIRQISSVIGGVVTLGLIGWTIWRANKVEVKEYE